MSNIERAIARFLKVGVSDYCDIETAKDDYTLVHRDGSISTFLKLHGSFKASGPRREAQILDQLTDKLSGIMSAPGFRLQFVVTRDPDANYRALKEMLSPAMASAKRLKLDLGTMISERAEVLDKKIAVESVYVAITTQLSVFLPSQLKEALAERLKTVRDLGVGLKSGVYGQSEFTAVEALEETHRGFIRSFQHIIKEFIGTSVVPVKEAIKEMAFAINPSAFSSSWTPVLPGDRVPVRLVRESKEKTDISHLQYPDIGFQLFPQAPFRAPEDSTLIKIGDRYNAPVMVDIPPQKTQSFDELFQAIPRDVPFRFMITIDTGHKAVVGKVGNKKTLATFMALTSSQSRQIRAAAQEILDLSEQGNTLVMATMNFCTWGPDAKTTSGRKAMLMQAAQGWGNMQLVEERGDPIQAWLGTIPAFSRRPSGNTFPWFLQEAISVLPISRPASAWDAGSMTFRTLDTKAFPYQPGSSKQTGWTDLFFAPPGFGKSVFLAAQNMGLILSPGRDQLPRIALLDIGFSSKLFVELVRQALPKEQRHMAQSFRWSLSKENSINPFDTPLGCRYPLSVDKSFLGNFMTLVMTPAGVTTAIPRLPELVGMVIDSMYETFSDENEPNIYEHGMCPEVDRAVTQWSLPIEEGDSWWKVVDSLFSVEDYHAASMAQAFAVPLLSDATSVLMSDHRIRDVFGSAKINGEPLTEFLNGMIVSALKEYPLLAAPTTFDTGGARIVSIDLQDVAKSGGDQATKRTAVVYMLARQALCKEFYRSNETITEIPDAYKAYHAKKIEQEAATPKKLCMDEFHRTSGSEAVREQVVVDIREGRKYGVQLTVLSQMLADFSDAIVQNANNVWILSKGLSEEATDQIQNRFKPSSDAMRLLRRYVNGPGPEGASFLYLGNVKGGDRIEQVLYLTLGPRELWAYSTTAQDVSLRGFVSELVGLPTALKILAKRFSGGSAQEYLEQRGLSGGDAEGGSELLRTVARELVESATAV